MRTLRWLALAVSLCSTEILAQLPDEGAMPLPWLCTPDAVAGSPTENTLLASALAGGTRALTSLRPLTQRQATAISQKRGERRCRKTWATPLVQAWFNASSANPDRDGAVWQGRGLTVAASAGVLVERGIFSAALRPLIFVSENRAFAPKLPVATAGDFRDPLYGAEIDVPYRFGDATLARLDPGESYVRVDWRSIAAGLSSAAQRWGPAHFNQLVQGTDGPGIPRAFVELRDAGVRIGRVSGSWQVGVLEASGFDQLSPGSRSRVSSAFVAAFSPSLLPALELGGSRFFHIRREPGVLRLATATLPFSGLLKSRSRDAAVGGYNQLASAFFRIAPSAAAVEFYGELFREDHNSNLRDLIAEPDHASAYTVGFRRAVESLSGLRLITIEHTNARFSHLRRVRSQGLIYTHSTLTEGHTLRGQALGSHVALGGGGTVVSYDHIALASATTFRFEVRNSPQTAEGGTHLGVPNGHFVLHAGQRRLAKNGVRSLWSRIAFGYGVSRRIGMTLGASTSY